MDRVMVLIQFPSGRHRPFKMGQINFGAGTTVSTVVGNFSPTGAVLEIKWLHRHFGQIYPCHGGQSFQSGLPS